MAGNPAITSPAEAAIAIPAAAACLALGKLCRTGVGSAARRSAASARLLAGPLAECVGSLLRLENTFSPPHP
jgi:hypothetical protein